MYWDHVEGQLLAGPRQRPILGRVERRGLCDVVGRTYCTITRVTSGPVSSFSFFCTMLLVCFLAVPRFACSDALPADTNLLNWLQSNTSTNTGLPYSFSVQPSDQLAVFGDMGETNCVPGILERVIVEEGLVTYDGALWQMIHTFVGGSNNLSLAQLPIDHYWDGSLDLLQSIRAGYDDQIFIYDPIQPELVPSSLAQTGERGFIFKVINSDGVYNTADPLDGKTDLPGFPNWSTIHWEDWRPVAGENAWLAMAALQLYHEKHFNPVSGQYENTDGNIELPFAEEIARSALIMQADNGGIRMAPYGTYFDPFIGPGATCLQTEPSEYSSLQFFYNEISTENCLSWYAAFRMLYDITGKPRYRVALQEMESYFQAVYDPVGIYFDQGMHFDGEQWLNNTNFFATDVQSWGIAVIGPEKIDSWFGSNTAMEIWRSTKDLSGNYDSQTNLLGVGFTTENDQLSVEWTGGAILAARRMAEYYQTNRPDLALEANADVASMRAGVEGYKTVLTNGHAAYSYSALRKWIPFGWYSHDSRVLSTASTCWMILVDMCINPFVLPDPVTPPAIGPPAAPMLNRTIASSNQVTMGWSISDYASGYIVHYGTNSGQHLWAIDVGRSISHTVGNLQKTSDYYFAVSAYNDEGESPKSNELQERTEPIQDIILNDLDAQKSVAWTPNNWPLNNYNQDHAYKTAAYGADSVHWRPMIPETGDYNVYYWLPSANASYCTSQTFSVHHARGSTTYKANPRQHTCGSWHYLGTHTFDVGFSGFVQLTDLATPGDVVADAIRFERAVIAPTGVLISSFNVIEHDAPDTEVGTLSTIDPTNTYTYSLVGGVGSGDNGYFVIVGNTLRTAGTLNYEVKNSYSIRIRATGQGGEWFEDVFTIAVTDVNEPAPVLDTPMVSAGGDVVLRWSSLSNHTYTLYHSTEPVTNFTLLQADIPATPPLNSYTDSILGVEQKFWMISTQE